MITAFLGSQSTWWTDVTVIKPCLCAAETCLLLTPSHVCPSITVFYVQAFHMYEITHGGHSSPNTFHFVCLPFKLFCSCLRAKDLCSLKN